MNGLRAALRLAWRDALNSRPRSALIIAMIALPVAAFTALPLLLGTSRLVGGGAAGTAVNALIIAMVVLETVLLAGPAFAVGLRRQRRLLALVSAAGGSPGQLRAVVLCSGLLLGGLGGLVGTGFGLLFGWAGRLVLAETRPRGDLAPWETPWLWMAAIVLTAVLSGLAAAYAPARQASRTDTAEVLSGHRNAPSPRRGLPVLGVLLIAAGGAVIPLGMDDLREFSAAIGAALLIIGFVLATPAVIALTARLADRLPLPLRLAVRDADRNRVRTAPAIAAIMAVTAALTALAIGGASDFDQERVEYRPRLQAGQTTVKPLVSEEQAQRVEAAVQRMLPSRSTARVGYMPYEPPGSRQGHAIVEGYGVGTLLWMLCGKEACDLSRFHPGPRGDNQVITDSAGARLLLGRDDPAVTEALDEGKVVVFATGAVRDGQAAFTADQYDGIEREERTVQLPAVQVQPFEGVPGVLIPPKALEEAELESAPFALVVDAPLGEKEQSRLTAEIEQISGGLEVYTERGFNESFALPLLILGVMAAVLVLAGALIATGLAAADSRPDLATLTAVGARPVTRRLLLMAQTGYIAVLGCALGLLAGAGPGIAVAYPLTTTGSNEGVPSHGVIIDIPWLFLLAVLAGVPLVASAVTALSVRGEETLPERAAT
ncbi:FtsX-like permease family protein [Actinocorallia populi]|uniref:FtsX-like permease family protein n=1 Tax=Actinocorallia populi TaxID=2079200 RepID=UPI000D0903CC|nr:FtsX-like permease family protein [Actinocorallia populi]